MNVQGVECVGCGESVAAGTKRFSSRVAVQTPGQLPRRFACAECHELALRAARGEEVAADADLEWAKAYGLGVAGGRTGANTPG